MNLRYIVNGIGIYIDPEVERTAKRFVFRAFTRQLEGLEADQNRESEVLQRIYVRHYDSLDLNGMKKFRIFPANSLYDVENDLLIETHMKVALRIETDTLSVLAWTST